MKQDDEKNRDARLRALVEAYGTNPDRWPAEERHLYAGLESKPWLAEERRLDAWLDASADVAPSADLLRRVAEIPLRNERARWVWPFGRVRSLIALALSTAAVGLVVGIAVPDSGSGDDEWDAYAALAFDNDVPEEVLP